MNNKWPLKTIVFARGAIIILMILFSVGCKNKTDGVAEIDLTRRTYKVQSDSVTIFTHSKVYKDTDDIWWKVKLSLKPTNNCEVPMIMFDTIVQVLTFDSISVLFRYTRWHSDTNAMAWAYNGRHFDEVTGKTTCYSIDSSLYERMISRIRSSSNLHNDTVIQSQTVRSTMFNRLDSMEYYF